MDKPFGKYTLLERLEARGLAASLYRLEPDTTEAGEEEGPRGAPRSLALLARGGEARASVVDVWEMASIWDTPSG